jgi:type VI secretion system protein ImpB
MPRKSISDLIPKSRITLTYRTYVDGQKLEEVVLPFRVLVMGDLTRGTAGKAELDKRDIRTLDGANLNAVMKDLKMTLNLKVPNKINPSQGEVLDVSLPIQMMKSFSPAEVAQNVPKIKSLLLLKKLLLEAQSDIDNHKGFRQRLRALAQNREAIEQLRTELAGYETFKLPAAPATNQLPASSDADGAQG